jgi:hypothetical protein
MRWGRLFNCPFLFGEVERNDGSMGDYFPDYYDNFLHFVSDGIY